MIPKVPIKGPQGYDSESHSDLTPPEPQERYEAHDEHVDYKGGEPTQDPTTLLAHEGDHTPNHTRWPKPSKPEYGKHTGRDGEGMYDVGR